MKGEVIPWERKKETKTTPTSLISSFNYIVSAVMVDLFDISDH